MLFQLFLQNLHFGEEFQGDTVCFKLFGSIFTCRKYMQTVLFRCGDAELCPHDTDHSNCSAVATGANAGDLANLAMTMSFLIKFLPMGFVHMGVSKNNGTPKSSILVGFSIIFTIHFGGKIPIFLVQHP